MQPTSTDSQRSTRTAFVIALLLLTFAIHDTAFANQYVRYSSDSTYPVQSTLDLSDMKINAEKVVSTDNQNTINIRDDTSSNIKQPKIHCGDSQPAMSGTRISSGNNDYKFELRYKNVPVSCRNGASPFVRSSRNNNQDIPITPMTLVLIKVADTGNTKNITYPTFQMCKRNADEPDNGSGCFRGENNGLARYRPTRSSSTVTVKPNTQTKTLIVKGTDQWLDTGMDVKAGDTVTITATGTWKNDPLEETPEVTADGFFTITLAGTYLESAAFASLIGRIGETDNLFEVGSNYQGTSSVGGRLYLQMNDIVDNLYDNSGELQVTVEITSP